MKKYFLIGALGLLTAAVHGEPLSPPASLVDEETCLLQEEYDGRNCIRNLEAFIHDFDGRQLRFAEELAYLNAYAGIHDDAVDAGELVAYALDGEYTFPQTDEEQLEQSLVHYFLTEQIEKIFVAAYDINADHYINIKDDLNGDNSITSEDEESYLRQLKMPSLKEGEMLAQLRIKLH